MFLARMSLQWNFFNVAPLKALSRVDARLITCLTIKNPFHFSELLLRLTILSNGAQSFLCHRSCLTLHKITSQLFAKCKWWNGSI